MLKGLYVTDVSRSIPATADNLINSRGLDVMEIDGLGRPNAELHTTELVGADASVYGTQSVKNRTITLSIQTRSNADRMGLYSRFECGKKKRLFFENDTGVYWIDGYVKGATYAAKPAQLTELEIPVFCPYPWFRSLRPHTQDFVFGNAVTIRQNGDIRAGVRIYATLDVTEKLTNFSVRDEVGNKVTYNSDIAYLPVAKAKRLLIDTTPGAHAFLRLKDVQNIRIENDWVTVPVGESTTITTSINAVNANGTVEWYDTWGGI